MNPPLGFTLFFILLVACFCAVFAKNLDRPKRTASTTTLSESGNSCDNVRSFFQMRNITLLSSNAPKGDICAGQCCGNEAEIQLRKQGQRDFASLLRHNSRSLQGLLSFTAATLQNHVSDLSRQSENKTLLLFSQVYKGMAVLSREPIGTLYSDIRNYILTNTTNKGELTSPDIDIKTTITQFFVDFFPLVYHRTLLHNLANKDFTSDYKMCLKKTVETILPFGDIPQQLSQSLSKSLEATRLLLQAFRIGIEVLNTTDRLLIDENNKLNTECHDALLKMTYCPKCQGLVKHAKPCSGYCLNVLRGCLTKYVAELDSPWNGYVEGIESLVNAMKRNNIESGVNPDFVIRSLDTKISEAIMHTMEKGIEIDNKVQKHCGNATFVETPASLAAELGAAAPASGGGKPRSANPRVFAPLPETQLLHFLTSIAKTRGFYGNLADTLCQDESFAEPKDQRCWNGERIAEYTKTVVDVGLDMQKYNPEVKPTTNLQNVDPRVADLVDKLRHVHHMAITSIGSSLTEVDYMQRDGVDGSGSGAGPDFEDNDDEYTRGSGSGYGQAGEDVDPRTSSGTVGISPGGSAPNPKIPPTATAGCGSITSTVLIQLFMVLLAFFCPLRIN